MNSIINYLFESSMALGVFSLFYLLALKQEKSFVFNRFYLLGSVVLSIALPFIHFQLESVPSDFVAGTIVLEALDLTAIETNPNFFTESFWIWCYLAIAAFFILRIARKAASLLISRRRATAKQGYRLCTLVGSSAAYTFWDTIYLGDQLDEKESTLILSHEEIHAKEKHSLDILFLEIVSVLFWINPLFLIIKKLARTNHEYMADSKAVDHINKDTYVQTLASQAIKQHGFILAHSFHTSSTLKRIKMINQQNKQIMKIKQVLPFVLGLTLVIVFGCEDATEQLSEMDDQEAAETIIEYQNSSLNDSEVIDEVYDKVEEQPIPTNGMTNFYAWVGENMKYPTQARKAGVEGKVFIQFIVDKSGKLTNAKVVKGIGAGCDAEAIRVFETAPNWTPGKHGGQPVKVRMIMPITFKLS